MTEHRRRPTRDRRATAWRLTSTPTAGFILNPGQNATEPGLLGTAERRLLRELARGVRELAAQPQQAAKRDLWYRHIALEATRPLQLVFLEDSWEEMYPATGQVVVGDLFWRQWEWYLRHLLFRGEQLPDDFVVEPDLYVPLIIHRGDWGVPASHTIRSDDPRGAYRWTPSLLEEKDLDRLHPATLAVDEAASTRRLTAVQDVFGDLLPVRPHCAPSSWCLVDVAANLRGTEQLMLDIFDRPAWLHRLMDFIAGEEHRLRRFLEQQRVLTLNNRNHYVDSGGIGYSRELPAPGFEARHVRLRDLWCHAAAQAAGELSPAQHEAFVLEHELPVLAEAGLVAYGCCESYTHKFEMLKRRVPKLRRVSVSPWCDVERAAAALTDRYIFSWKPNPALLVGRFDEDRLRHTIRRTLDVARDCRLEIVMKDTITLDHEPQRLKTWLRVLREEIAKVWGDDA